MPGRGLDTSADTPDGPEGWNKISDGLPPVPKKLVAKILQGEAQAPPRMPCRVNGLYWADAKVKGKEEAQ